MLLKTLCHNLRGKVYIFIHSLLGHGETSSRDHHAYPGHAKLLCPAVIRLVTPALIQNRLQLPIESSAAVEPRID